MNGCERLRMVHGYDQPLFTSALWQLHAQRSFGEEVECGVIRYHKAELHFAELSATAGHHQVEVAGG